MKLVTLISLLLTAPLMVGAASSASTSATDSIHALSGEPNVQPTSSESDTAKSPKDITDLIASDYLQPLKEKLEEGMDPNMIPRRPRDGDSTSRYNLLQIAAEFGKPMAITMLVEAGANEAVLCPTHGTSLKEIAKALWMDSSTFDDAIEQGLKLRAQKLVRIKQRFALIQDALGSNGIPELVHIINNYLIEPLHAPTIDLPAICRRSYAETAKVIADHPELVNETSPIGTPLHAAAYSGNSGIVRLLISARANVHLQRPRDNAYPIDVTGNFLCVHTLLNAGSPIGINKLLRSSDRTTHNWAIMKLLIEAGGNENELTINNSNGCLNDTIATGVQNRKYRNEQLKHQLALITTHFPAAEQALKHDHCDIINKYLGLLFPAKPTLTHFGGATIEELEQ